VGIFSLVVYCVVLGMVFFGIILWLRCGKIENLMMLSVVLLLLLGGV